MKSRVPRPAHPLRLVVAVAAGVAAAGVGASVLHAQAPAQPAVAAGPELPAGAARDLFVSSCANCHAIGLTIAQRRSAEDWTEVLERMTGFGAQNTPEETAAIHAYLAANFGPEPTATAAAPPPPPATQGSTPARTFPRPQGPNQWPAYGGGGPNLNYSELAQITPANVRNLKPAWTFRYGAGRSMAGDEGLDYRFEVTPLIIGGVMYISTPASTRNPNLKASITALRPETGEVIWKYESPLNIHGRGVAYWPGDTATNPRIIFATDRGLIQAVDVTTGQLARGFGRNGSVDAYIGVSSEIVGDTRRSTWTVPNPVTIYKDLIITGARPGEVGPPQPRGDIRAFDAKTGRLAWTFHTVPQPGEANHETYQGEDWRDVSGANVWSTMALDEANGVVYAPVGDLNADVAGPHLYAASLLALDAATGKLRWFKQITHRDIWDWDLPVPPVLTELQRDGKTIPAVILVGKHGLFFMFDRLTGEPINGFEERPTPRPDAGVVGEVWPTQPFPNTVGSVARTQMSRGEIPDLAPGMKAACTKFWDDNKVVGVPLYAPRQSSEHATVSYPSSTGGPNWGGGAYHPGLGLYVINTQNRAVYRAQVNPGGTVGGMNRAERPAPAPNAAPPAPPQRRDPPFTFRLADGTNISCGAAPYGELVAVDVNRERIAWRVPLGRIEALGAKGETSGSPNLGGAIVTQSGVVFIGATNDKRFRAFDVKTGRKLWEAELEASAHSTPISYTGADGKQYVVVAAAGGTSAGGPEMSDTLVAYALP